MKRLLIILILLLIPICSQAEVTQVIDVPTARTILRGYYDIDFLADLQNNKKKLARPLVLYAQKLI